jgi:hypothetical protein
MKLKKKHIQLKRDKKIRINLANTQNLRLEL